jgi:soluble lytic murein transglycosylase-like protein
MSVVFLSLYFVVAAPAGHTHDVPAARAHVPTAQERALDKISTLVDRKMFGLAEQLVRALPEGALDTEGTLRRDALLARIYTNTKRAALAEPLLVQLIDKDPALADKHLFELARARVAKGDFAAALTAADAVDKEGLYAADAFVLSVNALAGLAEWQRAANECGKSERELEAQSAERLLACGRVYAAGFAPGEEDRNDAKRSGALRLRYLVRHHPSREEATIAARLLHEMDADYAKLQAKVDASYGSGERALKKRKIDLARGFFTQSLALAKERLDRAEALFRLADLDERKQSFKPALEGYIKAADMAPGSDAAARALFAAGSLSTRLKNLTLAQTLYQRLLVEHPLADGRAGALFGLGFASYLGHDFEASRQFLSTLLTLELKQRDRQRARYWYGRTLESLDRAELAQTTYSEILRDDPTGYYSARAQDRLLALNLPALDLPFDTPTKTAPSFAARVRSFVERAVALARRSFRQEGLRLLDKIARGGLPTHDDALAVHDGFLALGETLKADVILTVWRYEHLSELTHEERLQTLRSRHPRFFENVIVEEARRKGLKSADVFAIVRQESRFMTHARSPAGARGLMQLMVPTANEVARALKTRFSGADSLYKPELNVKLGTYYLAGLIKQYPHKELAFGAYNAGPGNMGKWLHLFGDLPIDVFCELIPFDETREYVNRVVGYARGYEMTEQTKLGAL